MFKYQEFQLMRKYFSESANSFGCFDILILKIQYQQCNKKNYNYDFSGLARNKRS